ncbi:MAG: hypothetical protein K2X66_06615 [Cyanobacteria bacterium]|nr:hypothetical protein [Cyanobacteriota bacterium]
MSLSPSPIYFSAIQFKGAREKLDLTNPTTTTVYRIRNANGLYHPGGKPYNEASWSKDNGKVWKRGELISHMKAVGVEQGCVVEEIEKVTRCTLKKEMSTGDFFQSTQKK